MTETPNLAAAKAIGPSAHLYRALIEYSHDVVSAVDADGQVLYISSATRRYGRDPSSLIGRQIWDFLHPDEVESIRAGFSELSSEPMKTLCIEHRVGSDEDGWRHKETVMQNLLHEPSVRAIVIVTHDITERKEAEQQLRAAHDELEQRVAERTAQLRESEARYRRLIEGLDVDYIFFSQDRGGTLNYVSPSVKNVLGYNAEDIRRTTFRPYFTDNPINQSLEASYQAALAGKPPQHEVCELRHADGTTRILEYLDVPVVDDDGQVIAVEGIARDVTAQRRAEEALQRAKQELEERVEERTADLKQLNLDLWEEVKSRVRAEEEIRRSEIRFRSVVEDQTEFIVRWLPDGTRTFVNSSYCRFFGKSRDELIGTSFFPLIASQEERQHVREVSQGLTPENPISSYTHRVMRPDGSIGWTEWNDRAIFDEDGNIVEYQSVGRDVTGQKEAAERLQRQQEELAHVARLSVMGEMVAAMGHEIGQPLHAISTFASASQRALDANRPDTIQKVSNWSGKIQDQVTRAGEIIRRLRRFTRLTEAQREPFDLNQAVVESIELVQRDIQRHMVRTETDLDTRLPAVCADRIQIEQVLVNLLRNACEAMDETPDRDRLIRIETTCRDGHAHVSVRDRGVGMTDAQIQSAFKAFYTTKPEGTGIGLAISRRIIEEFGGRLWATRNDEGGMTFHFTLPPPAVEGTGDDR
jgi:PAS domain S-box-containing protein